MLEPPTPEIQVPRHQPRASLASRPFQGEQAACVANRSPWAVNSSVTQGGSGRAETLGGACAALHPCHLILISSFPLLKFLASFFSKSRKNNLFQKIFKKEKKDYTLKNIISCNFIALGQIFSKLLNVRYRSSLWEVKSQCLQFLNYNPW